MANKKPLKLSETHACAQQFESGDTIDAAFLQKQMSITADGSGLKLDGDSATPGNTKLYGTDGSGVKGWYAQPSGGGGGGVATVTGPGVDNTDAANPVVNARPYKVYTALLTQSGTDAPVANVLENTLGGTVVWTRDYAGGYRGTLTGAFPAGKFFTNPDYYNSQTDGGTFYAIYRANDDSFIVETGTDGYLGAYTGTFPIEIRIYP